MPKKGFNLLRPQVEPPTVWTKLYDYIVGSARVIVIIVELVVVVAFVFRVIVDVKSKNLDEEIEIKEGIVKSFEVAEVKFVQIQTKTRAYESIWVSSPEYASLYAEINKYIPASAKEISVRLDPTSVFITGIAMISDVAEMEKSFKASPSFTRIELDSIETEGSSAEVLGNFTIRGQVKEIPKRKIADTVQISPTAFPTLLPTSTIVTP